MIIAIPTGIKIFSWLINPFSKDKMLIKKYITLKDYNNNNNYHIIIPNLYKGNLYKIYPRSNKFYIKPNYINKELVVYGINLESNVNKPVYTSIVKCIVNIPNNILYIIVGILLTDGTIEYNSKKNIHNKTIIDINSRFRLKQSIKHSEYLLYVYQLLSHYCISYPKLKIDRVNGKSFTQLEFSTRALPCFTILRKHFYNGRIKIIPNDLYDLLNYESLAHIIICDGSFIKGGGICLHLQSFSLKELIFLLNIFKIKFNLDCTLHKSRSSYIIYIKIKSVQKLYPYIYKYIVPSIKYKFKYKLTLKYDSYYNNVIKKSSY